MGERDDGIINDAITNRQPESGKLGKPDFNIVNVSDGVVLEKIQDNDSRADALKNEFRENDGDHHNTPRDSSNRNEGEDEQPFTEDFMKLFGLCANMNQLKQDVDISQRISRVFVLRRRNDIFSVQGGDYAWYVCKRKLLQPATQQ